jgi:SSS family solute:Na+ symporter
LNPDGFLFKMGDMNFLSFGAWFFLFCLIFLTVVSLLTKAPDNEKIVNLTFGTISEEEKQNNKNSYNWLDIAISILIIIIVAGVMLFFNGS